MILYLEKQNDFKDFCLVDEFFYHIRQTYGDQLKDDIEIKDDTIFIKNLDIVDQSHIRLFCNSRNIFYHDMVQGMYFFIKKQYD